MQKITNPITAYRQKHNMSRKKLALQTGMPYATLNNIEGGFVSKMRSQTLQSVAEFTEKPPEKIQQEYREWRASLKEA